MAHKLDYTNNNDMFYDYCYAPYQPKVQFNGKLRSNNLLFNSLEQLKSPKSRTTFLKFIERIKERFGSNNTVWGIKKIDEVLLWEIYFYYYSKERSTSNILGLLELIKEYFSINIHPYIGTNYFVFSIDILPNSFDDGLKGYHLYLENLDNKLSKLRTGFSYFFEKRGINLENHYTFFDPINEENYIINKLNASVFLNFSKIMYEEILVPELYKCKSICIANKQRYDGIYFSGIDVNQFLFFLNKFEYPKYLIDFVVSYKFELNHLQYDVGFDYKVENEKMKFIKSGYFGTF